MAVLREEGSLRWEGFLKHLRFKPGMKECGVGVMVGEAGELMDKMI